MRSCPNGYYLNTLLSLCVLGSNCPPSLPYADNLTQKCTNVCSSKQFGYLTVGTLIGGSCVFYCPGGYFSNPRSGKCEQSCPSGLFAETRNNTCLETCGYDRFMDSLNNKCVPQCQLSYNLFGDLFTRKCVTQCNTSLFTFADSLTRNC